MVSLCHLLLGAFLKCHPEGPRTNCDPLQFVLGTVGEKLQKRKFSSVRDLFWGHKAGLCFVFDWFCFVGDRSLLSLHLEATLGEYRQPLELCLPNVSSPVAPLCPGSFSYFKLPPDVIRNSSLPQRQPVPPESLPHSSV